MDRDDYKAEIMEIKAAIDRIERDKVALEKRMALKRKRNMFTEGEAESLDEEIDGKKSKIAALQSRIRHIENERIRSRNLGGE
ncbi:MAG: hypothetical protein V1676_05680 [Candidatus Diapherotrites archaeon]